MDSRSPKRRKTASPSSNPARAPTRASFLSPTKASLARFNPELLPRAGSERRSKSRGPSLARHHEIEDTEERLQANAGAQREKPAEQEEDDLPPTSSEMGVQEQSTLRRGILYSSPSKRFRRGKTSSPLRRKAPPPMNTDDTVMTDALPEDAGVRPENDRRTASAEAVNLDPEVEKKMKEKEKLAQEMEALQEEIDRYESAVEVSRKSSSDAIPDDFDFDSLITLINDADPSASTSEEAKATPISFLLSSFLPFSKPPPKPTPESTEALDRPVPSHVPLDLDDPLPYLRLFTPFTYISRISTPTARDAASTSLNVHQTHTVDILEPQKLISATIGITIDTSTQKIAKLSIIDLSPWAERELGTWIRSKAQEKDLGALCWALGSYRTVSVRRAECWKNCQQLLGEVTEHQKKRGKTFSGRRLGGPASSDIGSDEDAEGSTDEEDPVAGVVAGAETARTPTNQKLRVTRKQLLKYLGTESMIFETPETILKIGWDIAFDWTGEAESIVKATAAFPGAWHDADTRKSLKKVPATFDALVRERGVYESVKAMVGLLFG